VKVVKVLHPDIRRSGSLKTRFFREMEALARFETPHIVAILDQGETPDGHPFFVMEYVEGSELRRAMKTGRMEFARAARLMRQIGQAVSYAPPLRKGWTYGDNPIGGLDNLGKMLT